VFFGDHVFYPLDKQWERLMLIVRLRFGKKQIFFLLQRFAGRSLPRPQFLELIQTEDARYDGDQESKTADNELNRRNRVGVACQQRD
jgi:hypothetical protein